MPDGIFALLTLLIGLTDMGLNYCGTESGCLGRLTTTPRLAISAGRWEDDQAPAQGEVYLRYRLGTNRGPFGVVGGLSVAQYGETWVGFGATYKVDLARSPFYMELHAMPGLYLDDGGFDLGGDFAFRSGIELGYENRAGWRYSISFDHRSNAELYRFNPGVDTVQFRISAQLN